MANTFNLGNGNWAQKTEKLLAYNAENNNYKPLPFSFDRASTATVVNKNGLIETVGVDEPRIDFLNNTKGHLLLEPSRQNEVTSSDLLPNLYWGTQGCTISSSSDTTSPDGASEVAKLAVDTTGAFKGIRRQESTAWNGKTITISTFVKYINSDYIFFYTINAVGGNNGIWFNIANGTVGTTQDAWSNAKVEDYGNGWYRCSANVTFNASGTCYLYILDADNDTNINTTIGNQAYIWGTQLEEGSYATSYIPTSGSAVTRSADYCYQDNLLTDIINASYPFTMYAEAKAVFDNSQNFLTFGNRAISNQYFTFVLNSDGTIKLDARANGISEDLVSTASAISNGEFFKVAVSMESATSGKISVNGNLDSKTNFTQQSVNTAINDLLVGMLRTATDTGRRMPIKEVKLYNTALSDSELQALTSN